MDIPILKVPTYFLIGLAVLCNVGAQACMKLYASKEKFSVLPTSTPILLSIFLYGISFILTAKILEKVDLSIASPLMAGMSFALVLLVSALFFQESISMMKLFGLLLITLGIYFISSGSNL